jgi:hypothetical protein
MNKKMYYRDIEGNFPEFDEEDIVEVLYPVKSKTYNPDDEEMYRVKLANGHEIDALAEEMVVYEA